MAVVIAAALDIVIFGALLFWFWVHHKEHEGLRPGKIDPLPPPP